MPVIFEEAALQSVSSETPVDRWPCFTLKNVTVLSESTKELVSMFSGHKNHAVCVVGYLQKIPENHAHLVLDQSCMRASTKLAVKNVTSWSCGRSPSDGSMEFYANGKAGRYLIRTSASLYETVFAQMTETASMYFFIRAKFRKMRKAVSELSNSYVNNYSRFTFNEYLNSASNSLKRQSVEDVRAGFHEYAEYIITMMLAAGENGSERLDWEASPMMRYFKQKCPEQNAKVRSRINPTGPAKLSFRPNFQRQEPAPARKQAKKPAQGDDDLDTTGPSSPARVSSTVDQSTMRRSARRTTPRSVTSLVPMHGLSDDFELLDDADESNESFSSNEGERRRPNLPINEQSMPPPRRWDETRHQELAADLDPYTSAPSRHVPRMLPSYELPNQEPQDPRRLWICEVRRCGFREYAADTAAGLERINEHLQEGHDGIEEIVRDPRDSQHRSAFGAPSSQQAISWNVATNPSFYLSSARNPPSTATTSDTSGVQRDESGPSSPSISRRRYPVGPSGNTTTQSSFSSSVLPLSSNTRSFFTSEADPRDDDGGGSSTVPEPTPRSRRHGVMRRY